MRGGFPVTYDGAGDDFVNLKMMCQLDLSEVLIEVECDDVYRDECMWYVCVSVFVLCKFLLHKVSL